MAGKLTGKVALITGATSGIGRAVAKRFVEEGAKVCAVGRSAERLKEIVEEFGPNAVTVQADVSLWEDNRRAVQKAVEQFGKLDIFVGNAGVFDGFVTLRQLPEDGIEQAFDNIFSVNVKGFLLGAKAAYPELEKTSGNMIFTLSNSSFYPNGGGPIYTASKHAGLGIVKELAYELAPKIRVNAVSPGGTITDIQVIPSLQGAVTVTNDGLTREARISSRNPLQIAQQPEDHVAAYVLLASDEARAMTGTVIESDGGLGVRGMPQKF